MHLPIIKKENRYRRSIVNFGGLNLSQSFKDGELRDCVGISHSEFPFITQRKKRETENEIISIIKKFFNGNEYMSFIDFISQCFEYSYDVVNIFNCYFE